MGVRKPQRHKDAFIAIHKLLYFLQHCFRNWLLYFWHTMLTTVFRGNLFVAFPSLTIPVVPKTWSSSRDLPPRLFSIHTLYTPKKHEVQLNLPGILTLEFKYHILYMTLWVVCSYYWFSMISRHYRNGLKHQPQKELPPSTLLTCWVKITEEGPNNFIHTMGSDYV